MIVQLATGGVAYTAEFERRPGGLRACVHCHEPESEDLTVAACGGLTGDGCGFFVCDDCMDAHTQVCWAFLEDPAPDDDRSAAGGATRWPDGARTVEGRWLPQYRDTGRSLTRAVTKDGETLLARVTHLVGFTVQITSVDAWHVESLAFRGNHWPTAARVANRKLRERGYGLV